MCLFYFVFIYIYSSKFSSPVDRRMYCCCQTRQRKPVIWPLFQNSHSLFYAALMQTYIFAFFVIAEIGQNISINMCHAYNIKLHLLSVLAIQLLSIDMSIHFLTKPFFSLLLHVPPLPSWKPLSAYVNNITGEKHAEAFSRQSFAFPLQFLCEMRSHVRRTPSQHSLGNP